MLGGMSVRLTVSLPDDLASALREVAGDNMSGYTARALRSALLREQVRSLPGPDPEWIALAEEGRGW
jgi:uncharacterized protein with von Willebrand factor type A (vWA) domain